MKNKNIEKLEEIYIALYKEIGVSFETIDKSKENWFLYYFLRQDFQDKIINDILCKNKLTEFEKQQIINSINLGVSPRG